MISFYVRISRMEEYWVAGSSATHDSAHKHPMTAIPIGANITIDGTQVDFSYMFILMYVLIFALGITLLP